MTDILLNGKTSVTGQCDMALRPAIDDTVFGGSEENHTRSLLIGLISIHVFSFIALLRQKKFWGTKLLDMRVHIYVKIIFLFLS